jgi:transposase-like protein
VEMDVDLYRAVKIFSKRRKNSRSIVYETQISISKEYFFWIYIAIEPVNKLIFDIYLSGERNMFVA